jgi:hypothetical protein
MAGLAAIHRLIRNLFHNPFEYHSVNRRCFVFTVMLPCPMLAVAITLACPPSTFHPLLTTVNSHSLQHFPKTLPTPFPSCAESTHAKSAAAILPNTGFKTSRNEHLRNLSPQLTRNQHFQEQGVGPPRPVRKPLSYMPSGSVESVLGERVLTGFARARMFSSTAARETPRLILSIASDPQVLHRPWVSKSIGARQPAHHHFFSIAPPASLPIVYLLAGFRREAMARPGA